MCEDLPRSLTKTGYYFVGWYDTANTAKILPASHVFKKNTNVKAKWVKGIKITFKASGGTFSSGKEPVAYIKAKTPVDNWIDPFISRKGYNKEDIFCVLANRLGEFNIILLESRKNRRQTK
jgi:uncharacterized repeat protein (TIGR02543 family)